MEFTLKGHAIGTAPYMIDERKMIAITEVPGSSTPSGQTDARGSITGAGWKKQTD
jgi:hypothetical protein